MLAQPTAVQHVLAYRLKGISAEEMLVLEQVREAGNTGGHGIAGALTVTSHACADMLQPLTAKELWCSMPGGLQVQGCFRKRVLVPWLLQRMPSSTQQCLAKRQLTCMLMDMALLVPQLTCVPWTWLLWP